MLFNCGHLFHEVCIEKDGNGMEYCWQCVNDNQIRTMINHSEINMVTLLKKFAERKVLGRTSEKEEKVKEVVTVTGNKKRGNRFGIFDKKIASVDTQAEILDLKLEIAEYYGADN
jgi:hypothetical protein